jgi:hypothetical protein
MKAAITTYEINEYEIAGYGPNPYTDIEPATEWAEDTSTAQADGYKEWYTYGMKHAVGAPATEKF